MAGSLVSVTTEPYSDAKIVKYTIIWTSDASGDVTDNQVELGAYIKLGSLIQFKFLPTGGPQPPDDLYDVTLMESSVDLFQGAGSNLSSTVPSLVRPAAPLFYDGTTVLGLVVHNAGAIAFGTVKIWMAL